VEYAACLIRAGILSESYELLDTIRPEDHPQALLFRSFAQTSEWNYEASNGSIRRYLELVSSTSYEADVARVNLAQGLVFLEQTDHANEVLEELITRTEISRNFLLLANALELAAHNEISRRNWSQAHLRIAQAKKILGDSNTLDAFLIRKEEAFLALHESKGKPSALRNLKTLRAEAIARRTWESVRDCDYHQAIVMKDQRLAERLWFGTPFESFRARLLTGSKMNEGMFAEKYLWHLGQGRKVQILNASDGQGSHHAGGLKQGGVVQRLLSILSRDFYRPKRPMEIFSQVFPKEFYSPLYSKDRFYQACLRLRRYFQEQKIPLKIVELGGFFRFEADSNFAIAIQIDRSSDIRPSQAEKRVIDKYFRPNKQKKWSLREYAQAAKLPERTASRHLKKLVENGWVEKVGNGPVTGYRWRKPN
jgi:hypothetical protein